MRQVSLIFGHLRLDFALFRQFERNAVIQRRQGAAQGGQNGDQRGPKDAKRAAKEASRSDSAIILAAKVGPRLHFLRILVKKSIFAKSFQNLSKTIDFQGSEGRKIVKICVFERFVDHNRKTKS